MQSEDKKIILLVEDQVIVAKSEANLLKKNGYEVIVAYSGRDAIIKATENPHLNLILMDIDLGKGMDGTEAAQFILKDREIPIVFISNHTQKEIVDKIEKITSYGYVVKNSGETVLIASIKMAFRLFEARAEILQSELKLLESDKKFHMLETQIDDVIWTMDMNFRFTYLSASVAKMHGYTVDEMMKLNLQDYLTPESTEKTINVLAEEINSFLKSGNEKNIVTIELEQIKKDKTVFPTEIKARFLLDNDSSPIGIIGVTRDVTDRKFIEFSLKQVSDTLNLVLEGAKIGLWDSNYLTGKVYRSGSWASMLGFSSEEVKDTPEFWVNIIHPDDFALVMDEVRKHEEGKTEFFKIEHRIKTKEGNYKWILDWGKIFERTKDGKPIRAMGVHIDIDDRVKAEINLKRSEENYRRFFQEDLSGVFLSTPGGKIKECNQAYVKMMEYDNVQELLNSNPVSHYTESQKRTEFLNLLRKEKKLTNYEGDLVTKKGKHIYTLENINGVFDDENNLVEFWGYVNNITDIKNAEQILKNAAAEKEALHRELLHRVKNSFNQIRALVYLEREKISDPKANNVLEDIEMRIGTLSNLYSILNESGLSQQINLGEYLNQITNSLTQSFIEDEEKIIVKTIFDKINISPKTASSVGLIVNEILKNSFKYAFPDNKKGSISISLKEINGNAEIEIADNGIGLPDNFNIEESTGMGLQLVNMLIQQIDGKLKIEGKKGTKFNFVFPIEE